MNRILVQSVFFGFSFFLYAETLQAEPTLLDSISINYSKSALEAHFDESNNLLKQWNQALQSNATQLDELLDIADRASHRNVKGEAHGFMNQRLREWVRDHSAEDKEKQQQGYALFVRREVLQWLAMDQPVDPKFEEDVATMFQKLQAKLAPVTTQQAKLVMTDDSFAEVMFDMKDGVPTITASKVLSLLLGTIAPAANAFPGAAEIRKAIIEGALCFDLAHEMGHWISEAPFPIEMNLAGYSTEDVFAYIGGIAHSEHDLIGLSLCADLGYNPYLVPLYLRRIAMYVAELAKATTYAQEGKVLAFYRQTFWAGYGELMQRLGVSQRFLREF